MKKLLLTSIFILVLSVFHQTNAQIGVRVGASFANFDGFNFDSRTGFHGGLYYGIPVMEKLTIEPAILYSQKGYKAEATSSTAAITENLNYIDIPVLARYNIINRLNIFAGPQASLLAARKREENGNISRTAEVVRGYDLAGVVGLGFALPLDFNIQASYDFGLTSLNYFNFDVKNRVLKLSVGKSF